MSRKASFKSHRTEGMALVEMLLYVFIFAIVSIFVTDALLSLTHSYASIKRNAAIQSAAHIALERITREVKSSNQIVTASSIFGDPNGVLVLNTDEGGTLITSRFFLDNGRVRVERAGIDRGPLTTGSAVVTGLVFRYIDIGTSTAVRIEVEADSISNPGGPKKFYSTAVLRSSYNLQ